MSNPFIDGLIIKKPSDKAPDFVIAKGAVKKEDFVKFLQHHEGNWLNFDILESRDGKYYAKVDDYKKEDKPVSKEVNDAIEYPDDDINPGEIPF